MEPAVVAHRDDGAVNTTRSSIVTKGDCVSSDSTTARVLPLLPPVSSLLSSPQHHASSAAASPLDQQTSPDRASISSPAHRISHKPITDDQIEGSYRVSATSSALSKPATSSGSSSQPCYAVPASSASPQPGSPSCVSLHSASPPLGRSTTGGPAEKERCSTEQPERKKELSPRSEHSFSLQLFSASTEAEIQHSKQRRESESDDDRSAASSKRSRLPKESNGHHSAKNKRRREMERLSPPSSSLFSVPDNLSGSSSTPTAWEVSRQPMALVRTHPSDAEADALAAMAMGLGPREAEKNMSQRKAKTSKKREHKHKRKHSRDRLSTSFPKTSYEHEEYLLLPGSKEQSNASLHSTKSGNLVDKCGDKFSSSLAHSNFPLSPKSSTLLPPYSSASSSTSMTNIRHFYSAPLMGSSSPPKSDIKSLSHPLVRPTASHHVRQPSYTQEGRNLVHSSADMIPLPSSGSQSSNSYQSATASLSRSNGEVPSDDAGYSSYEMQQTPKQRHILAERKRRQKINEAIMHLKTLLPAHRELKSNHKIQVLKATADYIREMESQKRDLERRLAMVQGEQSEMG